MPSAAAAERRRGRPGAPAPLAAHVGCATRCRAHRKGGERRRGTASAQLHRRVVAQVHHRCLLPTFESPESPTANRPLAGGLGRGVLSATAKGCEQEPQRPCRRSLLGRSSPWPGPPPLSVGPPHSASTSANRSLGWLHRRRGVAARLGAHRIVAAATGCGIRDRDQALHSHHQPRHRHPRRRLMETENWLVPSPRSPTRHQQAEGPHLQGQRPRRPAWPPSHRTCSH